MVDDAATDPELSEEQRAADAAIGIRAHGAVPLIKGGRLVARGHTSEAIGRDLHLTMNTVKTHLSHILRKLDAADRAQAVARAAALGLLDGARGGPKADLRVGAVAERPGGRAAAAARRDHLTRDPELMAVGVHDVGADLRRPADVRAMMINPQRCKASRSRWTSHCVAPRSRS